MKKKRIVNRLRYAIVIIVIIIAAAAYFRLQKAEEVPEHYVAVVDGRFITKADLDRFMTLFNSEADMPKFQFLNDVVVPHSVLRLKAEALGIDATEDEVALALQLISSNAGLSGEEFLAAKEKDGVPRSFTLKIIKDRVIISKATPILIPGVNDINITDQMIGEFYAKNQNSIVHENGSIIPLEQVKEHLMITLKDLYRQMLIRNYVSNAAQQMQIEMFDVLYY
ncbi:MAG: hypothetical protein ABH879_04890 [archaeon]